MTEKKIMGRVIGVLRRTLGLSKDRRIDGDTGLETDLGADSLDLFTIIMELEEKFDVEITEAEMKRLRGGRDISIMEGSVKGKDIAVSSLVELIQTKITKGEAA